MESNECGCRLAQKDWGVKCCIGDGVFCFIRYSEDKDALKELIATEPAYQSMEEDAFDVMVQYANAEELVGRKDDYQKEGKVDMCKADTDMNIALILSGGTGTRLGGEIPKQYLKVGKREILFYSLQTLAECEQIDGIQIVAHNDWREWIDGRLDEYGLKAKLKGYSNPGETRQLSIYNGLSDIIRYADQQDGDYYK